MDARIDYKRIKAVTKMSSAGLIYKYYGREILQNICKQEYGIHICSKELDKLHHKMYGQALLEVDANDNGITPSKNMSYQIHSKLADRVRYYNSPWNGKGYSQNRQFKKAMKLSEQHFMQMLHRTIMISEPAKELVKNMFE